MSDLNHLPLTVGAAKPAQKAAKIYEITAADRLLLGGTLLWCFLAVDTFLFAPVWGIGLTAAVVLWYFLLLAALGRKALFRRESAILLAVNLFLAATFALQSNSWIRGWNVLALLVLVPVHTCGLSAAMQFPWWRPRMLRERAVCFFSGLFSAVGAPFAALMPAGKSRDSRRLLSTVLWGCGAAVHPGAGALLRRCPVRRRHCGSAPPDPQPLYHVPRRASLGADPDALFVQPALSSAPSAALQGALAGENSLR